MSNCKSESCYRSVEAVLHTRARFKKECGLFRSMCPAVAPVGFYPNSRTVSDHRCAIRGATAEDLFRPRWSIALPLRKDASQNGESSRSSARVHPNSVCNLRVAMYSHSATSLGLGALCRSWRSEVINYVLACLRRIQRLDGIFAALYGKGGYEAPLQVVGRKRQCRRVPLTGRPRTGDPGQTK
jgi:hypothetical protein